MHAVTIFAVICFCTVHIAFSQNQDKSNQPHIVLIIADDVGWNDVGFHGSNQIPTPNIDALAYNGVILNRFYTLPTCTPTRAALLTGQYPIRVGFQGIPILAGQNRHLPFDVPILPEKLQELGYTTHLVGKWHLGSAYKNVTPTGRGFDNHFGYWNGYIGYFNHFALGRGSKYSGLDMHDNLKPVWESQGEYATKLLTVKAEEVIREHNESKPLFLMLSHLAAHVGKDGVDLEVPDVVENDKKFGYIVDKNRRLYAGMVSELDKSVGDVVEALSRKGILDNTLIFFFSDNGAQTVGLNKNTGSNWPLRGLKQTILEGGVRNVAIAYSSKFKNKKVVSNELVHVTDLMPTIYAAAGGNLEHLGKIDGINQWPTLVSKEKSTRHELLINIDEIFHSSGLIGENGRYKLVNGSTVLYKMSDNFFGEDGRDGLNPPYNTNAVLNSLTNVAIKGDLNKEKILELREKADLGNCRWNDQYEECRYNNFCLFDLLEDPCETTNIAKDFPELVTKLSRKLTQYWKELHPQKIVSVDPKSNPIYFNNTWYTWLEDDYVLS